MNKILLVGMGENTPKNNFIFNKLGQTDLDVFVLKSSNDTPWFKEKFIPESKILSTDVYNPVKALNDLSVFCQVENVSFDALFTFDEHLVLQTSVLAQAFNQVYTPIETITHSSHNKLLFRKNHNNTLDPRLIKNQLQVVNFDSIDNIKIDDGPVVIKPLFGSDSYGVKKIETTENLSDLKEYIRRSWSRSQEESYKNFNDAFLIEKYIAGNTFSIDGIVQDKNIHFAGMNEIGYGPEPYFFQISNSIPTNLKKFDENICFSVMKKVLRDLNFDNTPFHAEIKYKDRQVYVIEIAARAPGGQIMKGYEAAYGIDFVKQVINLYLNIPVTFNKTQNKFVFQKGVFVYENCIIERIQKTSKIPNTDEFVRIVQDGEKNNYPISAKPVYYYAVSENSRTNRTHKALQLEKSLKIVTR